MDVAILVIKYIPLKFRVCGYTIFWTSTLLSASLAAVVAANIDLKIQLWINQSFILVMIFLTQKKLIDSIYLYFILIVAMLKVFFQIVRPLLEVAQKKFTNIAEEIFIFVMSYKFLIDFKKLLCIGFIQ